MSINLSRLQDSHNATLTNITHVMAPEFSTKS